MRFLLVGGIGYLGGRLAHYLKSRGYHVTITTRRPPASIPGWVEAEEVVNVGPASSLEIKPLLNETDVVIYLAAPNEMLAAEYPIEALKAGGEDFWCFMEAAAGVSKPPSVIYLSTFHVYGKNAFGEVREDTLPVPVHPYSLGRYIGEGVVQVFRARNKLSALSVRLSNAFGAPAGLDVPRWSLVFNDLCRQAVLNRQIVLNSSGTQRRNFITMHDTVRALEFLSLNIEKWPLDGIINLGSALHLSILEVAEIIAARTEALFGYRPPVAVQESRLVGVDREFNYNIDRLLKLGFTFTGRVEQEVDSTLRLCAEVY